MKRFALFLLIIFGISYDICYPYYTVNKLPEEIKLTPTIHKDVSQDNSVFFMYDNYVSQGKQNLLFSKQYNFTPAVTFRLDIPLKLLVQNSVQPEISVDRLLIANLRANQYYMEYRQLQEKARVLLGAARRHQSASAKNANQAIPQSEKNNIPDIEKEKNRLIHGIQTFHHLEPVNTDMVFSDKIVFPTSEGRMTENSFKSDSPGYESGNGRIDSSAPSVYAGGRSYRSSSDTQLPWIFKVVLLLWRYMLNNRVEIILYIMFIAIAGFFVSLKVRQ